MNGPSRRSRALAAAGLATIGTLVFLAHVLFGPHYVRHTAADLSGPLDGARRILQGRNPYDAPVTLYVNPEPMNYPLPAFVLAIPLAGLTPVLAGAIFVWLTTAYAAHGVTAERWDPLLVFASAPAVWAWSWAQWSILFLPFGLQAWTVALALCKPHVGLAMFAFRPNWRGVPAALLLLALTLVWLPAWPLDWARAAAQSFWRGEHCGVALAPGGFVLLLALLRAREPGARLLLAQAVIPTRLWFYDQLALGLIPQSLGRRVAWVAMTWVVAAAWALVRHFTGGDAVRELEALLVAGAYGPALLFVLWPPGARAAARRLPAMPQVRSSTTGE